MAWKDPLKIWGAIGLALGLLSIVGSAMLGKSDISEGLFWLALAIAISVGIARKIQKRRNGGAVTGPSG